MKPGLNTVLLTLYLTFISVSSVYLYITRSPFRLLLIIAVLLVVYYLFSVFICSLMGRVGNIGSGHNPISRRSFALIFLFAALASFALFMFAFAGANPGSFQDDCISQLRQALSGAYDDWHPVWHTLVFFTFPVKVTGDAAFITIFQIVYMSLALGYMCAVIYKRAGIIPTVVSWLYIVLNPFTLYITVSPVKDTGFGIVSLVAMTLAFDMLFEKDKKSIPLYKCLILGFMCASSAIFRHNGILFAAFLLAALFFSLDKKTWFVAAVSAAVAFCIIQGPVLKAVGAAHSGTDVIQVVGLPMSVIGNVAKETPELLDEETSEFVHRIAPQEVWEERFQRGNFNLIKYGGIYDGNVFNDTGVSAIVRMALRSAAVSPQAALESFFSLTDMVYGIDVQDKTDIDVCRIGVVDNDLGIAYAGNEHIASILEKYYHALKFRGYNFFRKIGFSILSVLIVIAGKRKLSSTGDRKRILFALPLLAYDFGTMLLLSGHDSRFFFVSFLICPLTILILLTEGTGSAGHFKRKHSV